MRASSFILTVVLFGAPLASHAEEPKIKMYVVGNGWHAGLLLPAAAINELLPGLKLRFPKADSYEIGWGDRGFYQAKDITAGLALEALFASKGSLLHVVGLSGAASVQAFLKGSDVAEVCVSAADYQRMAQHIAQAFVVARDGQPVSVGAGLYGDSQFYQAHGAYSLFYTCNRWSAEVLQAGGMAISPRLSLTAGSVLRAVRKQGPSCAVGR